MHRIINASKDVLIRIKFIQRGTGEFKGKVERNFMTSILGGIT